MRSRYERFNHKTQADDLFDYIRRTGVVWAASQAIATARPGGLKLGLSRNNLVSNIPQKLVNFAGVWYFHGGRLNLKCPNGAQGSMDFRYLYVLPDPNDPKRVLAIHVFHEIQARPSAAATALALAKQWGISNTQPLDDFRLKRTNQYGRNDAWFDTIPRGPNGKYLNQPCPFYIEIQYCGSDFQPKFVALLGGPSAATQPAMKATSAPTR